MDTKAENNLFSNKDAGVGFIKTSDLPAASLSSEQKVILNRKANELFNAGEVERAKRIYITTGYSDGLSRVADVYMKENRSLEALKLYLLAHNKRKSDPLIELLAKLVSIELTAN
ncbi:MAG TPA: hypothetical protein IAA30_05635 [Candidatus Treponema faecavium]|nr:hypothetical protein [Candidatus Treponema faecavium]